MKNIFIFDMDGTLTPSRRSMTENFEIFFSDWAERNLFYLVSGSNLEKIKEQVPQYFRSF
jgi:phosphomannomutase